MTHEPSDRRLGPDPDDRPARGPSTTQEFRDWARRRLSLSQNREAELFQAVEHVLATQRQMLEESKRDAIRALSEGFAQKLERLRQQLSEKDLAVSNIARYFEAVIAELTDKSHRDPKTRLLNFGWFMERVSSFLAVEQRVRWCAVGVVDITNFKWYNDTLGHAVGDRIIERVAQILSDQIRSQDVLALERSGAGRDLHARFGGDEFCFLIPDLHGCGEASAIAGRFKAAVEAHDWQQDDDRLGATPVGVDVGVVCVGLGAIADRRGFARKLADELIHRADTLMYEAKARRSAHVHHGAVQVENGVLIDL